MHYLIYPLLGAVAGVLAGLLGVGGGIVIVPALVFIFSAQGMHHDVLMQFCLGTSLASIMFTSLSSARAHHKHGAVEWSVVKAIAPGIFIGTFLGSLVASHLSTGFLKGFFVVFLYLVSAQMLANFKPKPTRTLPGAAGINGVGGFIGVVSALVGIGGGSLSVPFMVWCNIPMHRAVGTSAAIGFPIALAGALGYLFGGSDMIDRPPYTIGFIHLPALFSLVIFSVLTAPYGAKIAHKLPVAKLKKAFAIFLVITATRMLWGMLK